MGILTKLEIDGSLVIEGTIPGLVCQGSFGTFKCCGHQILIIYYLTVMCLSESWPLAFYSKFSQVRLLRYRWLEYPFPAKTTYNCVRSNPCMYFLFSLLCVCVCLQVLPTAAAAAPPLQPPDRKDETTGGRLSF